MLFCKLLFVVKPAATGLRTRAGGQRCQFPRAGGQGVSFLPPSSSRLMWLEHLPSSPIPTLYIWTVTIHIVVFLVILKTKQLASYDSHGNRYFTMYEFLFSVGWVVLSLENTMIFIMMSETSGVVVLGLRLFVSSIFFQKMFGNPCGTLYVYLSRWNTRKASTLICPLCAQVLAIPFGICITLTVWNILATVNKDYSIFLEKEIEYFLSVHPGKGFLVEATVSFLMFLPGIFISTSTSTFLSFLEAIFDVFLVHTFGGVTGAFMNPMVALSCYLMWHYHYTGAWEHMFVFFLGPLVGTMMAVGVARYYKRKQE